jgi:hypothetical protein
MYINDMQDRFILYSPGRASRLLAVKNVSGYALFVHLKEPQYVLGVLNVEPSQEPCNGAVEVTSSAADDSFGPLLYDIAMSYSPNSAIMPDRRSVSDRAARVWQRYATARGDVEVRPLDDIANPQTPPPEDDCKFQKNSNLNFSVHGDPNHKVTPLILAHERFLTSLWRAFQSEVPDTQLDFDEFREKVHDSLDFASVRYFAGKYASR